MECKKKLTQLSKQPAGAIFLISRVGNDANAENFLSNLRVNKELQEVLYCCQDQLDERREVFRRAGGDNQYSSYVSVPYFPSAEYRNVTIFNILVQLINLFVAALDSQTK